MHVHVLIHGMSGCPAHLAEAESVFKNSLSSSRLKDARFSSDVHTIIAQSNTNDLTYDGLDWGAERVLREVSIIYSIH
jgi:hypothetical protein